MSWIKEMFHTDKAVIGLLHLRALPGDPFYQGNMTEVIEAARRDLDALQQGGVDGVLITNEFSLPYQKKVSKVTLAAMGRVIGAIEKDFSIPYGVEAIYDPEASIELSAATDAVFSRCVFTGAYAGDLGLVDHDVATSLRLRKYLDREDLKLFYFVNSEGEVYLNDRPMEEIVNTMLFNCRPEALVVAGGMAGISPEDSLLRKVKDTAAGRVPVFCGTGCRADTIEDIFRVADGAFVGTTFKREGRFDQPVEYERVAAFMEKVREVRP